MSASDEPISPTAARRKEILSAAREVFAADGFATASVDRIAHRAGIAKGTVYLYFPSKEALCEEALRDRIATLASAVEEAVAGASGVREELTALLRAKLEVFFEHRAFLTMYLAEFGPAREPIAEARRMQLRILEAILRRGQAAGELRAVDVELMARLILAVAHGLIRRLLEEESTAWRDEDLHAAIDLVLLGLAA